jgi:NOL1/NOP2/fmu family ribosome biogenesis protein
MTVPDVLAKGISFERLHMAGEILWALPEGLDDMARLDGLRVLRTGLLLAHMEGKRAEPDHALAMALRPEEAARTAELDEAQALAYQAGEVLSLGDLPAGYTLLTHHGVSLGFGKQAGGQMKNHYPKGLRRR